MGTANTFLCILQRTFYPRHNDKLAWCGGHGSLKSNALDFWEQVLDVFSLLRLSGADIVVDS